MIILSQTILISGAASGMGRATAEHFHQLGAKLILIDIQPGVREVAEALSAEAIVADVTQEQPLTDHFLAACERIGAPRACINCAGIAPAKRIVGREGPQALADFSRVIQINLIGSFNVMRLAAAQMSTLEPLGDSGERGVIINTASVAAFDGQIGQAAYSASKGGIVSMTLPAARELAQFGIRVNVIAPGLVETPMLLSMPQDVQNSLAESVPFPKRLAKPSEYARLAQHIIENEMINADVIRLDGALRMNAK